MIDSVYVVKSQHYMVIVSFKCSMLVLILLLINNIWFVPTILNEYFVKKGINVLENISAVSIVAMMSQMYRF